MSPVSIRDVAREAGVSIATVSYVLNNTGNVAAQTRARVFEVAARLNYKPSATARNLQASETRLLAYSWRPSLPGQFNPILDLFLNSMATAAAHHGYRVLVFPTERIEDELHLYEELLGARQIDGVVLSNTNFDDVRVRYLTERSFPFVSFGRANQDWSFPWVDVDGYAGTLEAARHLLDQGHTRIACIAWPEGSLAGHYRVAGFADAMAERSCPIPPGWVVRSHNTHDAAAEAVAPLLALPPRKRPTALIVLSDLMAVGVIKTAEAAHIPIGRALSLIAFDDSPIARFLKPPLSSLAQPIDEVGELLITMLVDLCQGRAPANPQVLLPPRLILRESSRHASIGASIHATQDGQPSHAP